MKRESRNILIAAAGSAIALLLSANAANAGPVLIVQRPGPSPVKLAHPVPGLVAHKPQVSLPVFKNAAGNHFLAPNAHPQLIHPLNGHYFSFGGHSFPQFAVPVYQWPQGYGYTHYSIGDSFPQAFWMPRYVIADYANYNLDAPPPGYQWVRFGPDLLLVNVGTGQIAQAAYGAFIETNGPPQGGYAGQ
jgi:hypothetical protein